MSNEYSDAAVKSGETNPLRLSNVFHLLLGSINLLGGGVVAFLLTKETHSRGLGVLPMILVAAALLALGLTQIARAWRDEKFRFNSDDIGTFATPEKFVKDGKVDQNGYLLDVLNNGVRPQSTPDNALLNKLYNWLPQLELAPDVIRWHAETQTLRVVRLGVTTLGFLLAWVFSKPEVFAWLAPLYLLLAINPRAILQTLSAGRAGDQQLQRPRAPTPYGAIAILLFSVFAPILIGLLPAGQLPHAGYPVSMVVVPAIAAMATMLVGSALFIISLKGQARTLSTSGVGYRVRKDLQVPGLSPGLIDSLQNALPYPRTVLEYNAGWHRDGGFGGSLLVEAETQVNAVRSEGSVLDALRRGWAEPVQQPMIALGLFGVLTGVAATLLTFAYSRGTGVVIGLTALSFFSTSQFCLWASRGLWNRVDFSSTLYRIRYKGSYRNVQRVVGNSVTGAGSMSENSVHIEHVEFWVAVAHVESVAFSHRGQRYLQSLDLKSAECDLQFDRIQDYCAAVTRRKADAYREEAAVRQIVQGNAAIPATVAPPPLLQAAAQAVLPQP